MKCFINFDELETHCILRNYLCSKEHRLSLMRTDIGNVTLVGDKVYLGAVSDHGVRYDIPIATNPLSYPGLKPLDR